MKVLLIILFITALQILTKCEDSYPKRQEDSRVSGNPLKKGIKLINANKFGIAKGLYSTKGKKIYTKSSHPSDKYTAFPNNVANYTQPEDDIERKPRVKKDLPDFENPILRGKRSVNETKQNTNIKKNNTISLKKGKSQSKHGSGKLRSRSLKRRKGKRSKKHARNRPDGKLNATKNHNKIKQIKPNDVHSKLNGTKEGKRIKKIKSKQRAMHNNKANQTKLTTKKVISRRLIAARDATIEEYPYMVSIQKDGEHWCSGALLNERLVITTANCIWKANRISRMRIRAGSRYYDRGGQTAKIQEVMKHPQWNIRSSPDNDLSLILLDRFLKFSNSIHGLDLPNVAMMPAFEDAWVTSWGTERRDGVFERSSRPLQVYHTRLVSLEKCNNVTQRFGISVTINFICLAQMGHRAPCTRDTGAPAVSDGIVWGLASWGIRKLCGTERYPSMFSYTASPSNIDFIINATSSLMSEQRFYPYPDRYVPMRDPRRLSRH